MRYNRIRKSRRLPLKKLIHLVMEGTRTEPQYFSIFRSDEYVLKFHKNRRNETSPKGLVKRAESVEKEDGLSKADQIWIVSDKDNWTNEHFKILEIWERKPQHNHALSNPSFEYWLLLHFEDTNVSSQDDCLNRLKKYIHGYDKNLDVKIFTPELIEKAVSRAKRRNALAEGNCLDYQGSTVYKLVEGLIEETPES